jgi:hypothetical protein
MIVIKEPETIMCNKDQITGITKRSYLIEKIPMRKGFENFTHWNEFGV